MKLKNIHKGTAVALAIVGIFGIAALYRCGIQKVCGFSFIEEVVRKEETLLLPTGSIEAEVVDTREAREKGLSGRTGLDQGKGMLFVFDHPGQYGFWMKDMKFSIDMVWINEEGLVVHVERHVAPSTYEEVPPKVFINQPNASYVLELASGKADEYGIYLGTKIKIGQ